MVENNVPIAESFTFGWETFKRNFLFLIGLFLAVILVSTFMEVAGEYDTVNSGYLRFIIEVISALVEIVLDMGLIVISLKFVAGEMPEFGDLFSRVQFVFHYLLASLVALGIIVFGLVLLIVPGIYFAIRLGFFTFYIVDEGAGPLDALQKSWDLTRGRVMDLFLFWMAVVLINILGFLALVVGLFASMPVSMLMIAFVFRRLQGPGPEVETQVAQAA
jgi:uncharacterized membrane protein